MKVLGWRQVQEFDAGIGTSLAGNATLSVQFVEDRVRNNTFVKPNTVEIWLSRMHAFFVTRSVSEENTAFLSLLGL
jgi:hypothetical protein